ncbi:MAG: cytochrome c biogenesis protein ResB [Sulfuritalea sp.]|nr:cytochrome c biogenesis protein ResB [Sulfuritalea sp.]
MQTEHPSSSAPVADDAIAGSPARRGLLMALASLRLTLVSLVLLLAAVVFIYGREDVEGITLPLVLPLSMLSLNLLAAMVTNKAFRRQMPLLVFHLALLAIIVLVAMGRLTYLRATTEVVTGGEHQAMDRIRAGPWHWGAMDDVHFENLGFRIEYKPGLQRDTTVNKVRWRDESGIPRTMEIGDQVPLVIRGYRFYTSSNKGFAALFRWEPNGGKAELGSINFPSYPANKDQQTSTWRLGNDELRIKLSIPEQLIDPDAASSFRLPDRHDVTVDFSWRVAVLQPGESVLIPAGRLVYVGLTTWMGYNVFYDWTMPWLLAACALAVLALGWHFWSKFSLRPWQPG